MILVGVDGGGTSTRAAVCDERAQIIGRGNSASSNVYSVGWDAAIANIQRAVGDALLQANLQIADVDAWGLGLGGAVSPDEQNAIAQRLKPFAGEAKIVVEEDAAAALAGAFGLDKNSEGAVLIAGTGSNCFGMNASGNRARVDGLGPLLGDRGSGYGIGEACLRAASRAIENCGPQTSLAEATLAHFKVRNLDELVGVVYAPDFARDRVASLFPIVCDFYSQGDEVAIEILHQSARELRQSAREVLDKLKVSRLALCGGLLENQTPVRAHLLQLFAQQMPEVQTQAPQFEPVIGAALLAHRLIGKIQ